MFHQGILEQLKERRTRLKELQKYEKELDKSGITGYSKENLMQSKERSLKADARIHYIKKSIQSFEQDVDCFSILEERARERRKTADENFKKIYQKIMEQK